jgi:hypothetical protein
VKVQRALFAGLSWILVAGAACSAGEGEPGGQVGSEPSGGSSSSSPTPGRGGTQPPVLSEAEVLGFGEGLRLVARRDHLLPGGRTWGPEAVTPDGLLVVDVARQPSTPGPLIRQSRVGLLDPRTGRLKLLPERSGGGPPKQIVGAYATRRWVVWVETPSTNLYTARWVLHSYDRRSGVARVLARSPRVGPSPPPQVPGGDSPTISGGRVYLTAAQAVHGHRVIPAIYTVAVDGSTRLRLLIPGASHAIADRGSLIYRRDIGRSSWQIHRRDLVEGDDEVLATGSKIVKFWGLAAGGGTITWATQSHGKYRLHVQTPGRDRQVVVQTKHGKPLSYLEATSRYAGFSVPSRNVGYYSYLYDVREQQLKQITTHLMVGTPYGWAGVMTWTPLVKGSPIPEVIAVLTR